MSSERRREQYRAYRERNLEACRERVRKASRKYRERNLETERARDRARYAANRELILEQCRRRYAKNRERRLADWARFRVQLAGELVDIRKLPEEWQPVARLIKETRRELRGRSQHAR